MLAFRRRLKSSWCHAMDRTVKDAVDLFPVGAVERIPKLEALGFVQTGNLEEDRSPIIGKLGSSNSQCAFADMGRAVCRRALERPYFHAEVGGIVGRRRFKGIAKSQSNSAVLGGEAT